MTDKEIKNQSKTLAEFYKSKDGEYDFDGEELANDLIEIVKPKIQVFRYTTATQLLELIYSNNLDKLMRNLVIALRIFVTMPVTVASAERCFSKLKLIKNYLRTVQTDDRLDNLALLSIEKDIALKLDINEVVNNYIKRYKSYLL